MDSSLKRKLVAAVVVVVAVVGAGGAIAATQLGSPGEESKAVVDDAAKQLGVQPQALSNALKQALSNRVDAAVAAGRITKEQGDAIKERIQSEDYPVLGGIGHSPGHGHGHFGHFGDLDAAATYLGLTAAELRTELSGGKTLADAAKSKGKTVDGLVEALVTAAKKKLDAGVADGRLTRAQADEIAADLEQRMTDLVNGALPPRGGHHFRGPLGPPSGEVPFEAPAPSVFEPTA